MSLRTELTNRRRATERRLAPHVDPRWTEQVLLELRLRDVPGDAIGAVLAEVDSHCAESGETAHEAFGDPVAYAQALDLPHVRSRDPRELITSAAPTGTQVLGMLLVLWSVPALVRSEPLVLTVGTLALAAVLVVELVLLARFADGVLRAVVRRPLVSWLAGTVAIGVPAALMVVLTAPAATLPAWTAAAGGAALLTAGTVLAVRESRRWAADADPVRSPVGPEASPGRALTAMAHATVWLVPASTLVLATGAWLVARAG